MAPLALALAPACLEATLCLRAAADVERVSAGSAIALPCASATRRRKLEPPPPPYVEEVELPLPPLLPFELLDRAPAPTQAPAPAPAPAGVPVPGRRRSKVVECALGVGFRRLSVGQIWFET